MFKNYSKYEVYPDGRIWSYSRKKFLKPTTKNGYKVVCLYDNEGNMKQYLLHRVIYEAVSGKPIPLGMQVNHINEDKTDNRFFENLNLMTPKENSNWGTGIERQSKARINGKRSKQVGAFKDGKLIMTFPSTREAGRQGFNQGNVAKCCRGVKSYKTYKGYTWRYI